MEKTKLIFATHNLNKATEIQGLLPDFIDILTLKDMDCNEDIPETSATIEGNAIQKAQYVYNKYQINCFADDTGLEIEALNNEPGIYSARYAGPQRNSEDNMALVLERLKGEENRNAQFRTVIALIIDGEIRTFEGIVKGEIRKRKKGSNGFGYDPIFEPENTGKSFAEMELEEKNKYSHRSRAIAKLSSYLKELE